MFTKFLSRKFIISILALVFITFFIDIDPAQKLEVIKWLVGFYLGANAVTSLGGISRVVGKK